MNDFYVIEDNVEYIVLSIILIFFSPIFFCIKKYKLFQNFTYRSFLNVINKSFYFQIIIGIIGLFLIFVIQKSTYVNKDGFEQLFIEVSFSFFLIIILYLPIIGTLNLIKFFRK